MLVVGASLARAFGIVGAANLIRYRSKIDDPKDAVVMLCALAVGLAVGRRPLRAGGVLDRVPGRRAVGHRIVRAGHARQFDLKIKAGKDTDALRPKIEAHPAAATSSTFELRTSSDEEVCYDVQVPLELADRPRLQRHPHASIPRATRRSSGPRRRTRQ